MQSASRLTSILLSLKLSSRALLTLALLAAASALSLPAQSGGAPKGRVERIRVHAQSLEGNLSGDPAVRDVSVYLPPSYDAEPRRRYPALYFLHGYTDSDAKWYGFTAHWINLPSVLDKAYASGPAREMIVVTPNAYTRFHGSMYSSSVTTGDWERFISEELVRHIDASYRTIASAASRGLAGHSMGGYGALRIGMKNPDVFSSVYLLSPCCLAPRLPQPQLVERLAKAEKVNSIDEFEEADFGTRAAFAGAAAWSPNPNNPPFFLDLPVKDGEPRPEILAKWAANAPLAMLDAYIPEVRRLRALAFDAGDEDRRIAAAIRRLDKALNGYGISHLFEIYEGDHLNRIAERIETKALPFFSKNLSFQRPGE